jgi:hypothetical protein
VYLPHATKLDRKVALKLLSREVTANRNRMWIRQPREPSRSKAASFEMKRPAAPFFGSNIGNGLGEIPAVAVKVLSIVLALAIGLVSGLSQDDGAVLSRPLAVTVGIFNANLHELFGATFPSAMVKQPSPAFIWMRWLAMRSRTVKPKALDSQSAAALGSG